MALLWVQKELEVDYYCVGEDHSDYKKELEIVYWLQGIVERSGPLDECVTEWFNLHGRPAESCILM